MTLDDITKSVYNELERRVIRLHEDEDIVDADTALIHYWVHRYEIKNFRSLSDREIVDFFMEGKDELTAACILDWMWEWHESAQQEISHDIQIFFDNLLKEQIETKMILALQDINFGLTECTCKRMIIHWYAHIYGVEEFSHIFQITDAKEFAQLLVNGMQPLDIKQVIHQLAMRILDVSPAKQDELMKLQIVGLRSWFRHYGER